jgi:hypothetical protein
MAIICFSGWKGSGKDECAKYLIGKHNAVRVALADSLKDSVAEEFEIDRSSLDDPKFKESPILTLPVDPKDGFSRMISEFLFKEFRNERGGQPIAFKYYNEHFVGNADDGYGWCRLYWTPRALAILKGSVNRSVMSDYWTSKTFEIVEGELNENSNQLIVVTDVRYKSEVEQFKKRFKDQVVFVRVNRFDSSPSNDPSERDLDDHKFDFYIDNKAHLNYTYAQLENILFIL